MKLGILLVGGFLSAMDPGCGAGVGANVANGPGSADGGGGGSGSGSGTGTAMSCGLLGSHTFCEDFGGGALLGAFDDQTASSGTLSLDSNAASAPHALLAVTTKATNTTRTYARLEKKIADAATRFTLSYSEYLDPSCVGPMDGVETGVVGLKGNTYWVAVRHGNPDTLLETTLTGGLYTQSHELRSSMPRGKWTKVTLSVDITKNVMALTVDGNVIVEDEPMHYPPGGGAQASQIAVGTLTDNLSFSPSACQVRIDDVAYDAMP
jgi:hypothetical protein